MTPVRSGEKAKTTLRRCLPYLGLLIVLAAEIGLRCYEWRPIADIASVALPAEDGLGDERFGVHWFGAGDFVPNQNGIWHVVFDRPFRMRTNSLGFRNHEERRQGAASIVVVGASTTFGPYLPEEDTWPAWLEHSLRRTHNVQVFNGARAGYTMRDKLNYIRDKIVDFKPDLVVMSIDTAGGVDQRGSYADIRAQLEKPKPADAGSGWSKFVARQRDLVLSARKFLESHSALVRFGLAWHKSFIAAISAYRKPSWDGPASDEAYRKHLREALDALKRANIAVMLVYVPLPYDLYPGTYPFFSKTQPGKSAAFEIARRLALETGTPFFDGGPSFVKSVTPEAGFLLHENPQTKAYEGDVHLTRVGNLILGNAIAAGMFESGLISRIDRYSVTRPALAASDASRGRSN